MSVTSAPPIERDVCLRQIDKLTQSHVLHGSEALCKILQYLSQHALEHPGTSVKEYQIATEVFGRPSDFDPHLDATIRVQVGRLRSKLVEYYSSVGSEDPIGVDLPKGTYALTFHLRAHQSPTRSRPEELSARNQEKPTTEKTVRGLLITIFVLSTLLAAAVATIIGTALVRKSAPPALLKAGDPPPIPLEILWGPFLSGPEEPWVIFSNAEFIGRPETGMRYYDPSQDSSDHLMDHYTGIGEVLAVRDLDHLFGQLKRNVRVKRGSLFTLDDAKNNNLIFVGSPAENLTLREIPSTHEFIFQRLDSGPRKGDLAIFNVHPRPGETSTFLPNPPRPPLSEDYAIVALVRGLNPTRSTLILAGTSTLGTQAAVEFVCQPDSVQGLLRQLGVSTASELKPFEAVIQVEVKHDVPVRTKLVLLRKF
jgi:hypothetical protein